MDYARVIKPDPRSRPRPHTFRPARPNRFVAKLVGGTIRAQLRQKLKVDGVTIDEADLARLRSRLDERCILMPSHSGGFEPYVIVHLSRMLQREFYYLAAMEAFEQSPFIGWIMQRMGCYSIIRGTADRPSFQMTRRLLAAGDRPLVIFPEGQTVWQNDTPFGSKRSYTLPPR